MSQHQIANPLQVWRLEHLYNLVPHKKLLLPQLHAIALFDQFSGEMVVAKEWKPS